MHPLPLTKLQLGVEKWIIAEDSFGDPFGDPGWYTVETSPSSCMSTSRLCATEFVLQRYKDDLPTCARDCLYERTTLEEKNKSILKTFFASRLGREPLSREHSLHELLEAFKLLEAFDSQMFLIRAIKHNLQY